MCLTTITLEILTASEDIICYKSSSGVGEGFYLSYPKGHIYDQGKIQDYVKLEPFVEQLYWYDIDGQLMSMPANSWVVEEGYHSHRESRNKQAVFIIPKGAQYIEGYNNRDINILDYVSETLIYVGPHGKITNLKLKLRALWNRITKK